MQDSLLKEDDANKKNGHVIYSSTYRLLDGFVKNTERERGLSDSNGWNPRIEEYLLEIQQQSNDYYLMLNEQASQIIIGKYVMLGICILITVGVAITTGVVLALNEGGLWLPIMSAVCLAVTACLNTVYEVVGFSDWVSSCRETASLFIKLGRKIEALKRIDSCDRANGIECMNKFSSKFEKYRKMAPTVRKKLYFKYFPNNQQKEDSKSQQITVPVKLVQIHQELRATSNTINDGDVTLQIDEVTPSTTRKTKVSGESGGTSSDANYSPEEKGKTETTSTSSTQHESSSHERSNMRKTGHITTPMTLDELFHAELRQNEEKDDMTRYENYFRDQVAVPNFMRRKTLLFK